MTAIAHPYLMFLGDAADQLAAKTAAGIVHWRRDWCVGQLKLPGCRADLGLTDMTIAEAAAAGCKSVIVGVANRGGTIAEAWAEPLVEALEAGMDVASGLHNRIADVPAIAGAAAANGRRLFDVRHPTRDFPIGTGEKRTGKRLLAVGTDCSVGKMYTALAIEAEMQRRGMKATFRATGQTGIFIAGDGVSVDAVIADFISGATEWLTPANDPDHWDIVEGQGSLLHPSYAGVTMGLVHGSQPDALVLCHEPTRRHMRGLPRSPMPGLAAAMDVHVHAARLTNPAAHCIAVAVNTSGIRDETERRRLLGQYAHETGLPAIDPVIDGVATIVDRLP